METGATVGSIETSAQEKKVLALASQDFNSKNKQFCRLFPHLVKQKTDIPKVSEQQSCTTVLTPVPTAAEIVHNPAHDHKFMRMCLILLTAVACLVAIIFLTRLVYLR